jgi:hypothetical protein
MQGKFPAKDIIDAGFLELVRYGIRKPDDSLIVDSLRVVDAVLKEVKAAKKKTDDAVKQVRPRRRAACRERAPH